MIPPFEQSGCLPSGLFPASFAEIEERFGRVDCVLLIGAGFPKDSAAEKELIDGLPFLEIELVDEADFEYFVSGFLAFDRARQPKGMVEVIL